MTSQPQDLVTRELRAGRKRLPDEETSSSLAPAGFAPTFTLWTEHRRRRGRHAARRAQRVFSARLARERPQKPQCDTHQLQFIRYLGEFLGKEV